MDVRLWSGGLVCACVCVVYLANVYYIEFFDYDACACVCVLNSCWMRVAHVVNALCA